MKILFINGSPNENGNTVNLASILLNGKEYETLNLTDLTIGSYGQTFDYMSIMFSFATLSHFVFSILKSNTKSGF